MVKNIYDEKNKWYKHEYFCDWCFKQIKYGEIFRSTYGLIYIKDLCAKCKKREGVNND